MWRGKRFFLPDRFSTETQNDLSNPIFARQGAAAFRQWLESEGVKNIHNVNARLEGDVHRQVDALLEPELPAHAHHFTLTDGGCTSASACARSTTTLSVAEPCFMFLTSRPGTLVRSARGTTWP